MNTTHPARILAVTLIAGSALFGLAPAASADETSGPSKASDRTQTSQQAPKTAAPPANAPKWLKRVVKQINKFVEKHQGPIPYQPWKPGDGGNIVCRLQGKC